MSPSSRDWDEKICSFCRFSLRIFLAVFKGPCRDVEENGQEKPRWRLTWPRGELICAVSLFLYICCLSRHTPLDVFRVNWLRFQTNFKRWKSGQGLSPRFKPFWRGVRGESFKKKCPGDSRYVPLRRAGFLRRFGVNRGIDFAQFGLESGMVFEGTTGMYERFDSIPNE